MIQIYGLGHNVTCTAGLFVPGVPKHMKRFESLITFDSKKIFCLLFLLINVLYIEII